MDREKLGEQYTKLVNDYKEALKNDISLNFRDFVRSRNCDSRKAENALRFLKTTVSEIKKEVLVSQGKKDELTSLRPGYVYERTWALFKDHLEAGNDITLRGFCILHNVDGYKMHKWAERHNYNVTALKIKLGIIKKHEEQSPTDASHFGERMQKRLAKGLRDYKHRLEVKPDTSLKQFCKDEHIEYKDMAVWMTHLGITVQQLKQAVILDNKCPTKRRNVFVQFKPNGGTNGDRLTGVKIQLADGSNVMVDECTVISLCAFINQYNNDQRRRSGEDV